MPAKASFLASLLLVLGGSSLQGQTPQAARVPASQVIDKALDLSSLTRNGKPFHAEMQIDDQSNTSVHHAKIVLDWAATTQYRLVLESQSFAQTLTVNGTNISELNTGDFYPGWLRAFTTALLDPAPRSQDPILRNAMIAPPSGMFSSAITAPNGRTFVIPRITCTQHDDRPNGITDERTSANMCFQSDPPVLEQVNDFTYNMGFSEYTSFGKKQIARKYVSLTSSWDSPDYMVWITGHLTELRPLRKNEVEFAVKDPTTPSDRILTTFLSIKEQEAIQETVPPIDWPPVKGGKLTGFMVIHIVTDKTGQVREASRVSADNGDLFIPGMKAALNYKFKPLIIDGVPHQIEAPLVIAFTTALIGPPPQPHPPSGP